MVLLCFEELIQSQEVVHAMRLLKSNKAIEIDSIPAEVLKCYSLLGGLCSLFNKCFTQGKSSKDME